MTSIISVAERGRPSSQTARLPADVVCAGDSFAGWNNFGVVRGWPYRTDPGEPNHACRYRLEAP